MITNTLVKMEYPCKLEGNMPINNINKVHKGIELMSWSPRVTKTNYCLINLTSGNIYILIRFKGYKTN